MDKGTGKEQHITITSSSNMSKEDIDKAVKDAEKYAEEDRKLKELVEAKNKAEAYILQTDKTLNEMGDKVSEDEKKEVRDELENLKKAVETNDVDNIKKATEDFEKKFYALSEKLYKNAGAQDQGQGPEPGSQNDDGTFNADYTEKDKK